MEQNEELTPKPEQSLVSYQGKKIDLDDFKSMYYMLNAKPDTDIKIFPEAKKVRLSDIQELNDKVQEKAQNHHLVTNITKATIVLSNNRILEFTAWAEFQRTNFEISPHTNTVSITWEMNIKLPSHQLPQPHTLRVRIGSSLRPSEMLHVILSKEEHEIYSEMAHTVCTVDFINAVLCTELFAIIEEWHAALPKSQTETKLTSWVRRHPKRIEELVKALFLFSGVLILLSGAHAVLSNVSLTITSQQFLDRTFQWLGFSLIFLYLMNLAGSAFATWVTNAIDKIDKIPIFELTKGDRNRAAEIGGLNSKLVREVLMKVAVSGIVFLIGACFQYLIKPVMSIILNGE